MIGRIWVENELPHLLSECGAAWLPRQHDLDALGPQALRQEPRLSGLAGALPSFEGYELTSRHDMARLSRVGPAASRACQGIQRKAI